MRRIASACGLCAVLAACGGSSDGPGPAPSPTVSSLRVTFQDILLVGRSASATASATMSNGQVQNVGTGWRSSAPQVATVTDSGSVRGMANGDATISVSFGGQEGSKAVRIAPDYDGRWEGLQVVTSCVDSEDFEGICEEPPDVVGRGFPIRLTARHGGTLGVAGEFMVEQITFPTFTVDVEPDGSIRFAGTMVVEGIRAFAEWHINSTEGGRATGTIREVYDAPGEFDGRVTYESRLSGFVRAGAASTSSADASIRSAAMQKLRRFRRQT